MSGFNDVVADWLQSKGESVSEVVSVVSEGSDWEGDTEAGFYASFEVTVSWVKVDGSRGQLRVDGEDADSLWRHVTNAWPVS